MGGYLWTSPYDWLADMSRSWDNNKLYAALCLLADKANPEDIEEIFDQEMNEDEYYKKAYDT